MNNKPKVSNKCQISKISLFSLIINLLPIEQEDIEPKLIQNFNEINKLLNSEKEDKFKYIYFDSKRIHKILYDSEEIISIEDVNIKYLKSFENLFYLDLLILANPDIVNYSFTKKFIKEIYGYFKNIFKNKLFLVIVMKIIIDLINNYKACDQYSEVDDDEELNTIEKDCNDIIKNNLNVFQKIGINIKVDELHSLKVDEIYINILNTLIKSNKFEDYYYIEGIIDEMKLDKIYITKKMQEELNKTLNMDKDYMKPYLVKKTEDLFDIKILNLFYILTKYIFRNSFYFFQIPLLLYMRKMIIFIIKTKLTLLCYFKSKYEKDLEINYRIDYIIKRITDTEYYYRKYIEHFRFCKLNAILFFYKIFFFDSQKKEIKELENAIENISNENYMRISNNVQIIDQMEIRFNIINNLYDIEINIGYFFIEQKKGEKIIKSWQIIEKSIKEGKIKKLKKFLRIKLYYLLNKENISNSLHKIFTQKEIDYFLKEVESLPEIKQFQKQNKSKLISKATDSINFNLNNKFEESSIIIQSYTLADNSKTINQSQSKSTFSSIYKQVEEKIIPLSTREKFKKSHPYKILEHCEVIGNHGSAEFIKQLSNGDYMSGGNDKYLIWYDKLFNIKEKIFMKEPQNNLYEIENENNQENEINILSFSKNKINFLCLDKKKAKSRINGKLANSTLISVYYLNKKMSLIIATDKIGVFHNKWGKNNSNIEKKLNIDTFYRGGTLLKNELEKIFVLTSNDKIPKGENRMSFYNYSENKFLLASNDYSFVSSYNNMCEINQVIIFNQKLLLAACSKKEDGENKNGILVINIKINEILDYSIHFIDTENFEVYCFCQILIVENNNSIYGDITNKDAIVITETEYILIGGFDKDKREGCIKLYKIKLSKKYQDQIEIQYIQDIYIEQSENFKRFDGTISCITQSTITGNILVTCWDGCVHLFKPPNIDYFIKNNKNL